MDTLKAITYITDTNLTNFNEKALSLFHYQANNNPVYGNYLDLIGCETSMVREISEIPFLPAGFFKTHEVVCTGIPLDKAEVFYSSSSTGRGQSRHIVPDISLYETSFVRAFSTFYDLPEQYCFLALLPSYLERKGSSLIYMINEFIGRSNDSDSGYFLYDHDRLADILRKKTAEKKPVLLIGVSYALMDFAELHIIPENDSLIVMETGGMKGRKKEMIREDLHRRLCASFGVSAIHSEYGMTELLSQAYSKGFGRYYCPPWMKVLIKPQDDPFGNIAVNQRGKINIIDLANVHSCAFIETEDLGTLHPDGAFEVLGREDFSEVRGCNVMV